jgi:hypothetical protein
MHLLRLAYSTQFVVSLVAFYMIWGEVGGTAHLDMMPWYLKLALGLAVSYSFVKATASAVSREQAWNGGTLRWTGILVSLLFTCGLATYYYHVYEEDTDDDEEDAVTEVQPCRRPYRPASPVNAARPRQAAARA